MKTKVAQFVGIQDVFQPSLWFVGLAEFVELVPFVGLAQFVSLTYVHLLVPDECLQDQNRDCGYTFEHPQ